MPTPTEFHDFPSSAPEFVTGTPDSRIAAKLLQKIRSEALAAGTRLPSEQAMAKHFSVSRTVIRKAIATLKRDGVLTTRQGSGVFVARAGSAEAPADDQLTNLAMQSLLNLIEVRRGIEGETAALAALRRTPGQLAEIEHAVRRIEDAVAAGRDGADEDVHFHLCIAEATGNPYWVQLVQMFSGPIRSAAKVTRANEVRNQDFIADVKEEHEKITNAIASGNSDLARAAAWEHMIRLTERVRLADREFWRSAGSELARDLAGKGHPKV